MSNVNIKRAVEYIRSNTTAHTPVVEAIVNAIQAVDDCDGVKGLIETFALRSDQVRLNGNLEHVTGFRIRDNGIGFTDSSYCQIWCMA